MPSPKPIVLTWEAWKASRASKRELLERLGLANPSRRQAAIGSQEKRLRARFKGKPDHKRNIFVHMQADRFAGCRNSISARR